jgi:hypothetical protein
VVLKKGVSELVLSWQSVCEDGAEFSWQFRVKMELAKVELRDIRRTATT